MKTARSRYSSLGRHTWLVPVVFGAVALALPQWGLGFYWQRQIILIAVYTLISSGLNLTLGYGGELALGQVSIFAAGAYTTAILNTHGQTDFLLAAVLSGIVGLAVGVVTGAPGLRLSRWSLAITSFFLTILIPPLVSIFPGQTGGLNGLTGILGATFSGRQLNPPDFYLLSVGIALVWLFVLRNLIVSRFGRALANLSASPQLVSSLGLSTFRLRLSAYALGAIPAGLAGAIFAYYIGIVDPTSFSADLMIAVLAASIIGGANSVWAAPVGAAIIVLGPLQASSTFQNYSIVAYGVMLAAIAALFPSGIAGVIRLIARWVRRRVTAMLPATSTSVSIDPAEASDTLLALPGKELVIEAVTREFSGLTALAGVDMTIAPGRVTAVIGANGAGKTTLLNAISGFVPPTTGRILLDGQEINGQSVSKIARSGVGRTFQTPLLPGSMSVLEVVESGRLGHDRPSILACVCRTPKFRRVRARDEKLARAALAFAGLSDRADLKASALPLGTRRLLEVVRCVAAEPNVILLDEPAAGLDGNGLDELKSLIIRAKEAGATVVLVEHNVPFVMEVADYVQAMDLGKVIASGPPEEVRANPLVIEKYLGRRLSAAEISARDSALVAEESGRTVERGHTLLSVVDAEVGYGDLKVVRGVSLEVREGQITALMGRNGVGKTTLLSGIVGLLPLQGGQVSIDGTDISKADAGHRARLGVSIVQEGKRVFRRLTVLENLYVGMRPLRMSRRERRQALERLLVDFPILEPRLRDRAGDLSGGQQQMVAIATALICQPRVLLVDEPSSGLSPVYVDDVLDVLQRLRLRGMGILLVEQQVEGILSGVADEIVVIDRGRVTLRDRPKNVSEEELTKFLYTS